MDRHSFSEPRPVDGCLVDLPTWEVDVFREGVEEPVFTLEINNTTLPPRMRKRKVVWKLPDSIEETPNFGSDERKRMLELFKKQRKSRKKLSKRNLSIQESDTGGGQREEPREQEQQSQQNNHRQEIHQQNGASSLPLQTNGHPPGFSAAPSINGETPRQPRGTDQQEVHQQHHDVFSLPKRNGHPPGFMAAAADTNGRHDNNNALPDPPDSNGHSSLLDPPAAIPPPGFANLSLHNENDKEKSVPQQPQSSSTTTDTTNTDSTSSRCFVVPAHSTNVPVDLAKNVVDIYYPCITQGHSDYLVQHYMAQSQKSLSVGTAHAVCHSPEEFLLQLQSLHGSQFLVKGVVAQPGISGSVLLLITGCVQHHSAAQVLPYCHSLSLVCSDEKTRGWQIHNDAMALLTE